MHWKGDIWLGGILHESVMFNELLSILLLWYLYPLGNLRKDSIALFVSGIAMDGIAKCFCALVKRFPVSWWWPHHSIYNLYVQEGKFFCYIFLTTMQPIKIECMIQAKIMVMNFLKFLWRNTYSCNFRDPWNSGLPAYRFHLLFLYWMSEYLAKL